MAKIKLTKSRIDSIAHPESGQNYYSDSQLPGFGLRVGAKSKTYFAEKRVKGRSVRVTIGQHGVLTSDQARKKAQAILGKMAGGHDPNISKRGDRSKGITLVKAFEEFLQTRSLKPRTIKDYRGALDTHLKDWKQKRVVDINRDSVATRHKKLNVKHGPAQANQTMRFLRSLLNYCAGSYEDSEGTPLIKDNPVNKLTQTKQWYRVQRRQTVIKNHELSGWYKACMKLENEISRDYLLLTLFTGLRKGEGLSLEADKIDLKSKTFTVLDPKNRKPLVLPLSNHLYKLLKERIGANGNSKYVFPSLRKHGKYMVEPKKQIAKIVEDSGVQFCLHDLRRLFITTAESLDIPAISIKLLVNHSTGGDVTAGYVMADVERLRSPMQKITDRILSLVKVKKPGKIIKLSTA
jgi:integrase